MNIANALQLLGGLQGNPMMAYNPLDIIRTPSSALTAAVISIAGYYFYHQVSVLKEQLESTSKALNAQLESNSKALNVYATSLVAFGCAPYDASSPKDSETNIQQCIANIKKVEKERDTGHAIAQRLNKEGSLDLTLVDDSAEAEAKIVRYFATTIDRVNDIKADKTKLHQHLNNAQDNINLIAGQGKQYHDDAMQTQAILRTCEGDKHSYYRLFEKEKNEHDAMKTTCKAAIDAEKNVSQILKTERDDYAKKYQDATDQYNDLKKKYDKTWF